VTGDDDDDDEDDDDDDDGNINSHLPNPTNLRIYLLSSR
jgi:hypothetical protein